MNSLPARRIVLIDDEPGVLKALTLLLQALGCEVLAFADPQEALTYLKAGVEAEVVLSDQRMPGLSGAALFEALRRNSIHLPFILMSGHAHEEDIASLLEAPRTAFLAKPFSPATLTKALAQAMGAPSQLKAL